MGSTPTGGTRISRSPRPCTAAIRLSIRSASYVTPSGVVSGCPGLTTRQLVDGGYAESDALGTLVDIAPTLIGLVRRHNANVLARSRSDEPLVVPTVVFLQNHFGTDVAPPPSNTASELLVPPRARRAHDEQQQSRAFRQRLEEQLADPCPPTLGCGSTRALPTFVLIAPATEPQVTAPLGWTLSRASIDNLTRAMNEQAVPACGSPPPVPGQAARLCTLWSDLVTR